MISEQKDRLIMELREEIAELKRRLGLHNTNSSKPPPSSDGLGKPNATQRT